MFVHRLAPPLPWTSYFQPAASRHRQSDFVNFLRKDNEKMQRRQALSKYVCFKVMRSSTSHLCPIWDWYTHYVQGTIPGDPGRYASSLHLSMRLIRR